MQTPEEIREATRLSRMERIKARAAKGQEALANSLLSKDIKAYANSSAENIPEETSGQKTSKETTGNPQNTMPNESN